jgi:hypothetical protein
MKVNGRLRNEPALFRIGQQRMWVSMHPQSSTITIGVQNPQEKVSTTFVFPLVADFFSVPFFTLYFLVLAIFKPSFLRLRRMTTASSFTFLDVIY